MVDILPRVFPFRPLPVASRKGTPPRADLNLLLKAPDNARVMGEWQRFSDYQSFRIGLPNAPTKFGKTIDTFFAKGFGDAEAALMEWIAFCDEVANYGPADPLFPATASISKSNSGFSADGFTRDHWKNTEPVRKIARLGFEAAGLSNYGPHAFRHMLARHSAKHCMSVAEFVATSQDLGHTDVLTTLRSYGQISFS